ncbi:hypothetical protein DPMN_035133 [Dreissena polymorpha]|uniref:Uncharacterized protein n=1 Tax=Dreissena polymorpha TaxID=45954 RepID=A0A9D4RLL5_DREPO|nr:hypothetical protein DPMN_035133 [Dreissena polymorpha]
MGKDVFHIVFSFHGLDGDLPLACLGQQYCTESLSPGDMSKPSQLSSFDGRQKGLLWANKCCSHVPDDLVGLLLRVGDVKQLSETFVFKCLCSVSA